MDSDKYPVLVEGVDRETHPFVGDSDSDGLNDSFENKIGTNPLSKDTNNDGLNDSFEYTHNLNPTTNDTDGDGLKDLEEQRSRILSPHSSDTDSDGLNDSIEVELGTSLSDKDSDNDGLTDGIEYNTYDTNPLDSDTDNDGINDFVEIDNGSNPSSKDTDTDGFSDADEFYYLNTSAKSKDSDNDGVNDSKELQMNLNPKDEDTDGDGLSDGVEIRMRGLHARNNLHEAPDPLHKDIFIKIDYSESALENGIDFRRIERLEYQFKKAPVNNKDNFTGIDLHVIYSRNPINTDRGLSYSEYLQWHYNSGFSRKGVGFHHVLITEEVEMSSNRSSGIVGVTNTSTDGILVQSNSRQTVASIILHELGHQLGLKPDLYEGIDSKSKSKNVYPSAMNYNLKETCSSPGCDMISFAGRNSSFNDWRYISNNMRDMKVNTSKLESNENLHLELNESQQSPPS